MNILYILLLSVHSIYGKEVLRHVQTLYRHGDRASVKVLSPSNSSVNPWPFGLGQLTDIGMKQHFALGKWMRMRYKDLISAKYNHKEIYVRSTDVDRTLMSAETNLAGMYFDDRDQIITNLTWRPIPVHTVPEAADTFLSPLTCRTYDIKLKEMYASKTYKNLFKGFERTLELMRNVSHNKNLQYEDSWYIFDILFCEKTHNMTSPSWVTKEVYNNISQIYGNHWKMMFKGEELARFSGGRLLDEIVTKMKNVVKGGEHKSEKMRMYSGHDINIAALLSALGVYDDSRPPYAAAILIELWETPKKHSDSLQNWIVKVFYKTSSTVSPNNLPEMRIKGCKSQPCTLGDFIKAVKPRLFSLDSYKKLCPPSNSGYSLHVWLPIYGLVISLWSLFK